LRGLRSCRHQSLPSSAGARCTTKNGFSHTSVVATKWLQSFECSPIKPRSGTQWNAATQVYAGATQSEAVPTEAMLLVLQRRCRHAMGVGAYGFVAAVRSIRTEWVPLRQCKRSHTAFGRLSRNRRGFNVGVGQPMLHQWTMPTAPKPCEYQVTQLCTAGVLVRCTI
jgi:hypothetical protein